MTNKALIFESNDGTSRALASELALLSNTEVLDVARTPSHALQLMRKHGSAWDLAVVDLSSMAHMALVVLQASENRLAHQRVLVLAKNECAQVRAECRALGADFVFSKDGQMDEFFSTCKRLASAESALTRFADRTRTSQ